MNTSTCFVNEKLDNEEFLHTVLCCNFSNNGFSEIKITTNIFE